MLRSHSVEISCTFNIYTHIFYFLKNNVSIQKYIILQSNKIKRSCSLKFTEPLRSQLRWLIITIRLKNTKFHIRTQTRQVFEWRRLVFVQRNHRNRSYTWIVVRRRVQTSLSIFGHSLLHLARVELFCQKCISNKEQGTCRLERST